MRLPFNCMGMCVEPEKDGISKKQSKNQKLRAVACIKFNSTHPVNISHITKDSLIQFKP
jgi:hypothetical protein